MNDFLKLAGEIVIGVGVAMAEAKYEEIRTKLKRNEKLTEGERYMLVQLVDEKLRQLRK